jgi:hypothetical protein
MENFAPQMKIHSRSRHRYSIKNAAVTAAEIDGGERHAEVRGRSSVVTCEILAAGQALYGCCDVYVLFISFVAAAAKHMNAEPVVGLRAARQ